MKVTYVSVNPSHSIGLGEISGMSNCVPAKTLLHKRPFGPRSCRMGGLWGDPEVLLCPTNKTY